MSEPVVEPTPPVSMDPAKFFTQEQVNAMLEAERNKYQPKIDESSKLVTTMKEEVADLQKFRKAAEKAEADRQKAIEESQRVKREAEMSAKEYAEQVKREADERFAAIAAEQERREALYQQELRFMKLQTYIQRRSAEESENIAPELMDFINGEDEAQVEASIEMLKTKTAQIVENMRTAQTRARSMMPGVAPAAGTNGITAMDQQGDRQVSAQDIAGMNMSQYAELRKRIGVPSGSGRGLFD